ncbi:MAG: D-alanine--D-alanine ligase [Candidatus Doudnabacteria bacterium]|nr:D-alanine--D-alanine ligase [Candidatus Doudnabacteria bacterium]
MKTRIGLIFGGQSDERFVSKQSAIAIKKYINKQKYSLVEIEITPKANSIARLIKNAGKIDKALLALHGPGGEDGRIQAVLDLIGIKYNSSGVLASAIAMNKSLCKEEAKKVGLDVANGRLLIKNSSRPTFKKKCVIKPNNVGSSLGVSIANNPNELSLGIKKAFTYDDQVLVEDYIPGKEFTVPVLNGTALPVVEIIPNQSKFFDYKAKYEPGGSEEIVPARLNASYTKKIQELAVAIHKSLNCKGLTRSDFIFSNGKFYFLEINTIPGMTENSLAPKSAQAAGMSFTQFIDKIIG